MRISPSSKAYFAGLFDGEGHIGMNKRRPSGAFKTIHYSVRMSIGMTSKSTIDWVATTFGGNRYERQPYITPRSVRRKVCYDVAWSSRKALAVLLQIQPYLITKAKQADIAIAYQQSCARRGGKKLSDELLAHRESIYQQLRLLNKKAS